MKCLVVSEFFYPGFKAGGPARSVTNLVRILNTQVDFDVFTRDRDLTDNVPYRDIELNRWFRSNNTNLFYSSKTSFIGLYKLFSGSSYDVIYLNSFFSLKYSIMFLLLIALRVIDCKRVILAPRGELTRGAMSIKSYKKRIYLRFFKLLRFHNLIEIHVTSQMEMMETREFLPLFKYILAPNMHDTAPKYLRKYKEKGTLNLSFISRISIKKNLHVVIQSLMEVTDVTINFFIAGPIDDGKYWKQCSDLIRDLPSNICVKYLGALDREFVIKQLNETHVFILPTLNENYGHAIVEAMYTSNVVILSNQTPWNSVSKFGGYVTTTGDVFGYAKYIMEVANMSESEYNRVTLSIYNYCMEILAKNERLAKLLFERI